MTRIHRVLLLAGLVFAPITALAQGAFAVGIGPSFPIGDIGKYAGTGFNVLGAFTFHIPYSPLGVRLDGSFSQFSYDHIPGNARVFAGTANAVYSFRGSIIRPYVLGGYGLYHAPHIETINDHIETSSGYASGLNAGIGARTGGVAGLGLFAEFRFHYVFTPHSGAEFFPLTVGITF
ncbi:MAG TPA: hypothetical protein VNW46_09165 [Gemmatimonadaceae bacterium]|nr:hypothetical protein [Gemmatimonadaceae bacterium]